MKQKDNALAIRIGEALGFDFNWGQNFGPYYRLDPPFEKKFLKRIPSEQ